MRSAALPLWLLPGLAAAQVHNIGDGKQLFIDHRFVEISEGITLRQNAPHQTRERLLTADAAFERDASLGAYSTVAKENGKVRLWYQIHAGEPPPGQNPPFMGMAYAESQDGIHFTKPILGLVTRNGSKENNVVMPPDEVLATVGGATILQDTNPDAPPDRRYKSWSKFYSKPGYPIRGPHRVWYSADGLRWQVDERKPTGLRAADTQPSWFWDPRVHRYVGYSREWVRERAGFGARMASYNESDDMIHWDSFSIALAPDERDLTAAPALTLDPFHITVRGEDVLPPRAGSRTAATTAGDDQVLTPTAPLDFYGPGVFPYEGVYIALIPVFYHWRGSAHETWPSTFDVQLAVSRDGRHFARLGQREPFLRPGPAGSFDSKMLFPVPQPIRMGDELWIYYTGQNRDHADRVDPAAARRESWVSRAVLRLDGFVSADAAYEGGWLLTPPLTFSGSRLELNLDTGGGGQARVEIVEASGRPIPGFTLADADTLNTNSVRATASWRGSTNVHALAGRPIRLRVQMRAAKLYAFQFRN